MKKFCPIAVKQEGDMRWESRVNSLKAIHKDLLGMCRGHKEILLTTNLKPQAAAEMRGVIKHLESFSFILFIVIWFKV